MAVVVTVAMVMVMAGVMVVMVMIVIMPVISGMAAHLHVAAQTASAFFAHIKRPPPRRFPVPARAATRRSDYGTGDIR
jgi:ABC-type lipoprotein release transport system permease subunit